MRTWLVSFMLLTVFSASVSFADEAKSVPGAAAFVGTSATNLTLTAKLAVETKTDPAREVFVENSVTNFTLAAETTFNRKLSTYEMNLSTSFEGVVTLVCFVDGKLWQHMPFQMPGTYRLNLRGLKPGQHRVTIQAVTPDGRVGRTTTQVERKR